MTDKPEGVKNGATLAAEWREKGYHCQLWADFKYFAGVIEGEVVAQAMDVGVTKVTKEMHKDLEYREHKWKKDGNPLANDTEEIYQEYQCPLCKGRKFLDTPDNPASEDIFRHFREEHPGEVFPEPM